MCARLPTMQNEAELPCARRKQLTHSRDVSCSQARGLCCVLRPDVATLLGIRFFPKTVPQLREAAHARDDAR
jgi:hypothetical protein